MSTVCAENLRLTWNDCAPQTSAVHVGISGRHRDPVQIIAATSSTVFVRFHNGQLREVHPADLARDPERGTIASHSEIELEQARAMCDALICAVRDLERLTGN